LRPIEAKIDLEQIGEAIVTVGGQRSKAMADQIMAADKSRLKSQLGVRYPKRFWSAGLES